MTPKASLTSQFRKGIVYLNKEDFDEKALQDFLTNGGRIVDGKYLEVNCMMVFTKSVKLMITTMRMMLI